MNGLTNGIIGLFDINDCAAFDTLRRLIPDAQHLNRANIINHTTNKTRVFMRPYIKGSQHCSTCYIFLFHIKLNLLNGISIRRLNIIISRLILLNRAWVRSDQDTGWLTYINSFYVFIQNLLFLMHLI